MKRILIVTYYWPPGGGAGVQRWVKLSRCFVAEGLHPFIVTVDPRKASYALIDSTLEKEVDPAVAITRTSTREPYGLYKSLMRKKEIPFGGFANEDKAQLKFSQKLMRFIRGNLFLPDARVGWNRFAYKACCELIEKEKIDAVITTSPPHSTQLVGLKLKKKYNLPWLADLRDPWTDIYYYDKLYLTAFSKKRDARTERSVLENADAVTVVSDAIREKLLSKFREPAGGKFYVVPNGFDESDFASVEAGEREKRFVVSYTGTLTNDYRLEGFLSAVKNLFAGGVPMSLRVTGSMPDGIRSSIASVAGENVRFKKHVSHHEAIAQMKSADLLLLVIPDAPGNEGILTGKLFEYLAAQKPVLCIGPVKGDAAKIIRECGAGEAFAYEDAIGIEKMIREKYGEWKAKGQTGGGDWEKIKQFSRGEQAKEMIRVLHTVGRR